MSFRAAADPQFARGLHEFRAGRFFEAHEEWERLWKRGSGTDRLFLQGLIQLAAGLVHSERGRTAPALRLFRLARQKLAPFPEGYAGLPLDRLRSALDACLAKDQTGGVAPLTEIFRPSQSKEGT